MSAIAYTIVVNLRYMKIFIYNHLEYLINVNKNRAPGLVAREPVGRLDLAIRQDLGAGRRRSAPWM